MQGSRPARIGEQIRQELADLLSREVHDPGIGFVTITHVKVSADLQVARVYYTTLGDEAARRNTAKALERATPFLRRQIAARVRPAPRAGAGLPVRRVDRPRGAHRGAAPGNPRRRPTADADDEPAPDAVQPATTSACMMRHEP